MLSTGLFVATAVFDGGRRYTRVRQKRLGPTSPLKPTLGYQPVADGIPGPGRQDLRIGSALTPRFHPGYTPFKSFAVRHKAAAVV